MIDINDVRKFAREKLDDLNYIHTRNVVEIALRLAGMENADKLVIEAAAWLHDIGKADPESKPGNHHLFSIKIADQLLAKCGADKDFAQKVRQCIMEHMGPFGDGLKKSLEEVGIMPDKLPRPSTPESKCLYDADMIDFIGPCGIAKIIYLRAKAGKGFSETLAEKKQQCYRAFADLQTNSGKELGKEYHDFAIEFFKKMNMEEW